VYNKPLLTYLLNFSLSVRVCVCVYLVCAPTFESLDLETSFLVHKYIFTISVLISYIKVIRSRSRSQVIRV